MTTKISDQTAFSFGEKKCWGTLSLLENNKAMHSPTLNTAGFFSLKSD